MIEYFGYPLQWPLALAAYIGTFLVPALAGVLVLPDAVRRWGRGGHR